jgi:hypothetical protein
MFDVASTILKAGDSLFEQIDSLLRLSKRYANLVASVFEVKWKNRPLGCQLGSSTTHDIKRKLPPVVFKQLLKGSQPARLLLKVEHCPQNSKGVEDSLVVSRPHRGCVVSQRCIRLAAVR